MVREVGENGEINSVLGKALSVLGHADFFEPICNLLHGGPPTVSSWHDRVFDHRNRKSIPFYPRYHASDGNFRHRLPSISGFDWDFRFDSMGQHNAKLMLSTPWHGGQLTLSLSVDTPDTKIGIAASLAWITKRGALLTSVQKSILLTNGNQLPVLVQSRRSKTSAQWSAIEGKTDNICSL